MTSMLLPFVPRKVCSLTFIGKGRGYLQRRPLPLLDCPRSRLRVSSLDPRGSLESGEEASFNENINNAFENSTLLRNKVVPLECSYLKKLRIQDFVLVKNQEIDFDAGFNVVTGESGAGKSVLIEGLSQILGKATLGDCIRSSCSQAILEGVFHLSPTGAEQAKSIFRQYSVPVKVFDHFDAETGGDIVFRREVSAILKTGLFIEIMI